MKTQSKMGHWILLIPSQDNFNYYMLRLDIPKGKISNKARKQNNNSNNNNNKSRKNNETLTNKALF